MYSINQNNVAQFGSWFKYWFSCLFLPEKVFRTTPTIFWNWPKNTTFPVWKWSVKSPSATMSRSTLQNPMYAIASWPKNSFEIFFWISVQLNLMQTVFFDSFSKFKFTFDFLEVFWPYLLLVKDWPFWENLSNMSKFVIILKLKSKILYVNSNFV